MDSIEERKQEYLGQIENKTSLNSFNKDVKALLDKCSRITAETVIKNFDALDLKDLDFSKIHVLFVSASNEGYIRQYIAILGANNSGQYVVVNNESEEFIYLQKKQVNELLERLGNIDNFIYRMNRPDLLHSRCYFMSIYKDSASQTMLASSEMLHSEYLVPESDPVTVMDYFLSSLNRSE